jgi:hypothetical protein
MSERDSELLASPDGFLQLETSESEDEEAQPRRRRPTWTKIWRSTSSGTLGSFRESLPTHCIDKSNPVGCTADHLFDKDFDLACCVHQMRSQMVLCRSQRCRALPPTTSLRRQRRRPVHVGTSSRSVCPRAPMRCFSKASMSCTETTHRPQRSASFRLQ